MLEIRDIVKRYASRPVVDRVSINVEQGQFVSLLGPSGSGKSTVLRMIAGLIQPEAGTIRIGDEEVYGPKRDLPPEKRRIGMVFQDYALWPHMSVSKNIAFGLKLKKWPRSQMTGRIHEMLELVRLSEMKDRYPFQLSGGQQQRVALARALATDPRLLLLDEPLSSLDTQLRESLRGELVVLLRKVGVTTVYVTHDQTEALEMSDVIVVLRDGTVEQIGTPLELYNNPASLFVATFLGATNVLEGPVEVRAGVTGITVAGSWLTGESTETVETRGALCVRPESVEASAGSMNGKPNTMPATLIRSGFLGGRWQHICSLPDDTRVSILSGSRIPVPEGGEIAVYLPVERCRLLPAEVGGRRG